MAEDDAITSADEWLATISFSSSLAHNHSSGDNGTAGWVPARCAFRNEFLASLAESDALTRLFTHSIILLVTLANLLLGCELDWSAIWRTCRRPLAPSIGVFAHFCVMPMAAFIIGHVTFLYIGDAHSSQAVGFVMMFALFVTGASPAGGAASYWTLLFGGNVHLAATMSVISSVSAFALMPFWLLVVGARFVNRRGLHIQIPYGRVAGALGALVVPLAFGMLASRCYPNVAGTLRKITRPFLVVLMLFLIVFGTLTHLHIICHITWPIVISALLLPFCGFTFGAIAGSSALCCRRSRVGDMIAIAIESGVQNTGITIAVLKLSLPPEHGGDISILMPVLVACGTPIWLCAAYMVSTLFRRCRRFTTATFQPVRVGATSDHKGGAYITDSVKRCVLPTKEHSPPSGHPLPTVTVVGPPMILNDMGNVDRPPYTLESGGGADGGGAPHHPVDAHPERETDVGHHADG